MKKIPNYRRVVEETVYEAVDGKIFTGTYAERDCEYHEKIIRHKQFLIDTKHKSICGVTGFFTDAFYISNLTLMKQVVDYIEKENGEELEENNPISLFTKPDWYFITPYDDSETIVSLMSLEKYQEQHKKFCEQLQ